MLGTCRGGAARELTEMAREGKFEAKEMAELRRDSPATPPEKKGEERREEVEAMAMAGGGFMVIVLLSF